MTPTPTRPYDAAAYLNTAEDCALYLQAVIEEADGDPTILAAALDDIARASCMTPLYQNTFQAGENPDTAFASNDNPSFSTVTKVCKALGLKLHAEPLSHAGA